MIEKNTMESQGSLFNSYVERADNIRRALGHMGSAVHLEMSGLALDGESLGEADEEKYRELGKRFVEIAQFSNAIAESLGVNNEATQFALETVDTPETSFIADAEVVEEDVSPEPEPTPENKTVAPSEQPKVRRRRRKQQTFEGKYYDAIIPPAELPAVESNGHEPIPLTITADSTISLNGTDIELKGDRMYIFNALMGLRDQTPAAKDIRGLGEFRPGAEETSDSTNTAFSNAMKKLRAELNEAAETELIKKHGDKLQTKYGVDPRLQLIEGREPSQNSGQAEVTSEDNSINTAEETSEDVKKN